MCALVNTVQSHQATAEFDRWWARQGEWVELANQRRGGESGVQQLLPQGTETCVLYSKRQINHLYRSLAHPLGAPTILREYKAYQAFQRLGVGTPTLVYCGTRREATQWQAILVTEALSGYSCLDDWYGPAINEQIKQLMLQALAKTLVVMNRASWQHGCLYSKHVFVRQTGSAEHPVVEVALLDLEKSRRRLFPYQAKRHDLRQLNRHRGPLCEADWHVLLMEYQQLWRATQ